MTSILLCFHFNAKKMGDLHTLDVDRPASNNHTIHSLDGKSSSVSLINIRKQCSTHNFGTITSDIDINDPQRCTENVNIQYSTTRLGFKPPKA